MYGKEFVPKGSSIERPHPEDLLGVGGPCANLTTYGSGFPGHRGDNQYVLNLVDSDQTHEQYEP